MKSVFFSLLFLLILFLVSHYIFEPTYLYYEIWWLDIPMHLLGGLGVGFVIMSIAKFYDLKLSLLQIFLLFMVVAIVWEIYEYARGIMVYDDISKYLDTVKDIVMGSIGLYSSYSLIKRK
ncbi:MAG: hypothetical protein WCK60_00730 [Candidatus Nomurabacteria bacterium]